MYSVISTGKRTLIKRPVIVTLVHIQNQNLIINFIFPDAEALEISLSLGQNVNRRNGLFQFLSSKNN